MPETIAGSGSEAAMGKLRLGVIGAGSWAVASHLPNLLERTEDVEFVAVSRRGKDQLERIRDRYGFALASEDYRDVLAAGIDICVVASPSALHYEHVMASLKAGASVLLEKPVTVNARQAWDLVDAARRLNRDVVVAYGWNYNPMVREAKRVLSEGKGIGTVEQVMVSMSSVTRELLSNTGTYMDSAGDVPPDPSTWTDPRLSGGGYAQAQLSHALGLALWLTGLRGEEVFAFMSAPLSAPVELHDAISVRYEGGAIGTITGGSAHAGADGGKHHLEVRAIGSEGQLLVDVGREAVWLYNRDVDDLKLAVEADGGRYDCIGPVHALVDRALGRPVENCSPLELGARTVEILDAAYRSAASGRVARVQRPSSGIS
jgi:predicted dehydrogenase